MARDRMISEGGISARDGAEVISARSLAHRKLLLAPAVVKSSLVGELQSVFAHFHIIPQHCPFFCSTKRPQFQLQLNINRRYPISSSLSTSLIRALYQSFMAFVNR